MTAPRTVRPMLATRDGILVKPRETPLETIIRLSKTVDGLVARCDFWELAAVVGWTITLALAAVLVMR